VPQHVGGVGLEHLAHPWADDDAAERLVARRHRLGECDEVGRDAVVGRGEPRAEAAEAGDDLVEHEQSAVRVAQRPQPGEVVGRGGVDAAGADHGLGHDGGDLGAPLGEERAGRVEVVVGDRHDVLEQAAPPVAVERQALQRGAADVGAVIAERAGDHELPVGLP
jgi:hypothetical protein